ncbi:MULTISPECIES: GspH/FimT family pseudopilin [unclassified Thioalkalivibrio]|uniref:GspH/FimT family pseudopilin n=1 Tax=unclassified Thioalkalivibrio TaxID=2621013 RepID=UPI0003690A70|nr:MULTISPECIES: GspH/FimT family pseudopilin [unclassified Thioalkalivibrio]
MANRSSSPGFTLIELVVTLAVMAILLAASVPVFNMIEQRRVVGAAESALHQIQIARTEAIKQGRDIYFVSEAGSEWCHGISESPDCSCSVENSCTVRMAGTEDPVERTVRANQFRNIDMPAGDLEIQFSHVRGTAVSGAPATLEFSSPKGYGMEVEINAIGRPSVCGTDNGRAGYRSC